MMRVIDADEFIWYLTDIYHKLGAEPSEIHFSLNDIIRNLDSMKAENVTVIVVKADDDMEYTDERRDRDVQHLLRELWNDRAHFQNPYRGQ